MDFTPLPVSAGPTQTLATRVVNYVRDRVQNGEMEPGTWYSVYQLSDQLGISRSPVRDGLLRLEEAGVIEFVRNRGFKVVEPQPADVADIFSLRLAIEPAAAARAARDITPEQLSHIHAVVARMADARDAGDEAAFFAWDQELHDSILAAGHSIRGRDVVARLRTHTRLLSDSTVRSYRSLAQVHSEHLPIVAAIEARDAERARETARAHLIATGMLLLRQALHRQDPQLAGDALDAAVEDLWATYTA